MAPLPISPFQPSTAPNTTINVPPQRWAFPNPLDPANPESPWYTGRPVPSPPPSSSSPPPPSDWSPMRTLAISLVAYVSLCNFGTALTMAYWNKNKRPYPRSWVLTLQWLAILAIWVVTVPVLPVHGALQLLVQAFLYWRYALPARFPGTTAASDDDLGGQELHRQIDAYDARVEGTGRVHRALVAFVGLPPLRAGKLSWAAANRLASFQAREQERAERRARRLDFWTLPPYDGVVLPPYETVAVELEGTAIDTSAATTAAATPNHGDGGEGFVQQSVVGGGGEESSSTRQEGTERVLSSPPAYQAACTAVEMAA